MEFCLFLNLTNIFYLNAVFHLFFFLTHTSSAHLCANELEALSSCCPLCHGVKSKEHPFGGKNKKGKAGMFHAVVVRGDPTNSGDLVSCALSSSLAQGFGGVQAEDLGRLSLQEKEGECHKKSLPRGSSELLLPGGCFLVSWSSRACFSRTAQCKELHL